MLPEDLRDPALRALMEALGTQFGLIRLAETTDETPRLLDFYGLDETIKDDVSRALGEALDDHIESLKEGIREDISEELVSLQGRLKAFISASNVDEEDEDEVIEALEKMKSRSNDVAEGWKAAYWSLRDDLHQTLGDADEGKDDDHEYEDAQTTETVNGLVKSRLDDSFANMVRGALDLADGADVIDVVTEIGALRARPEPEVEGLKAKWTEPEVEAEAEPPEPGRYHPVNGKPELEPTPEPAPEPEPEPAPAPAPAPSAEGSVVHTGDVPLRVQIGFWLDLGRELVGNRLDEIEAGATVAPDMTEIFKALDLADGATVADVLAKI